MFVPAQSTMSKRADFGIFGHALVLLTFVCKLVSLGHSMVGGQLSLTEDECYDDKCKKTNHSSNDLPSLFHCAAC